MKTKLLNKIIIILTCIIAFPVVSLGQMKEGEVYFYIREGRDLSYDIYVKFCSLRNNKLFTSNGYKLKMVQNNLKNDYFYYEDLNKGCWPKDSRTKNDEVSNDKWIVYSRDDSGFRSMVDGYSDVPAHVKYCAFSKDMSKMMTWYEPEFDVTTEHGTGHSGARETYTRVYKDDIINYQPSRDFLK